MGSWRVTDRLTAGMYYSYDLGFDSDNRDRNDPGNYSKDTPLTARYEFNRHFFAKLEGHYIVGIANGFYESNNADGLEKTTKLMVARVGFAF